MKYLVLVHAPTEIHQEIRTFSSLKFSLSISELSPTLVPSDKDQ